MTPIQRRVAAVSAPILLALSLTACGGGAPTDASEEDFCAAYDGFNSAFDPEASSEEQVEALQDGASELEDVGTPEGISEEEREGFEVFVGALGDVDEDALDELEKAEDEDAQNEALGVSEDDSAKAASFTEYAQETCA